MFTARQIRKNTENFYYSFKELRAIKEEAFLYGALIGVATTVAAAFLTLSTFG